jgi:hypothetical protein
MRCTPDGQAIAGLGDQSDRPGKGISPILFCPALSLARAIFASNLVLVFTASSIDWMSAES